MITQHLDLLRHIAVGLGIAFGVYFVFVLAGFYYIERKKAGR